MGRKIPGKKHKGVKDPEKQQLRRFNSLKDKINAPPSNPHEQDVPKSLARLMELKEKTKKGEFDKKNKGKAGIAKKPQHVKNEDVLPAIKQGRKEPNRHFLHRVDLMCKSVIREAAFQRKYKVKIERDPKTGKVDVVKRERDEVEEMIRQAKKSKRKNKKPDEVKLTKAQKKLAKRKEKQALKSMNKVNEFEQYKDEVKFGEVVHEPPSLVAPRKVEKLNLAPRPGTKDLHLKSMLKGTQGTDVLRKTSNKVIDKKGKRKDLPGALRRQLDKQQKEIIEAYRNLKANRDVKK